VFICVHLWFQQESVDTSRLAARLFIRTGFARITCLSNVIETLLARPVQMCISRNLDLLQLCSRGDTVPHPLLSYCHTKFVRPEVP
jgi:hypothetical protein